MTPTDIDAVMSRAIAAVGKPCRSSTTPANLLKPDARGWWRIGVVGLLGEPKSWQVYWNPELGRGWLWGIRHLPEGGVQPRKFEPPQSA